MKAAGEPGAIVVRPAGVADAEAVARVRIASWRGAYRGIVPDAVLDGLDLATETDRWRGRLAPGSPAWTLVAVDEAPGRLSGVAGFASAGAARGNDEAGLGEVWAISVAPHRQREGIGRVLLGTAVDRLAALGFAELILWVFEANAGARAFYERMDWHLDGASRPLEIGDASPPIVRYRLRPG